MRKRYRKEQITLGTKAIKNNCLSSIEVKNYLYPSLDLLKLWIRKEKDNGNISENKVEISAYLNKLECNSDYSIGLYTFVNKYTGNTFQLDYKYYGRLWWVFSENLRSILNVKPRSIKY